MPKRLSDAEILDALMQFGTITAAAKELGVSRATLSRRVNSESFKELETAFQAEILENTTNRLLRMNDAAIDEIMQLIYNDQSPRTRLAAAKTVLTETKEFVMFSRVAKQLKELQAQVKSNNS